MQQTLVITPIIVCIPLADSQPPLEFCNLSGDTAPSYPLGVGVSTTSYQQQHYLQGRSVNGYQIQTTQPLPFSPNPVDYGYPDQNPPTSSQYLQFPLPQINPAQYYHSGHHSPDWRQDINSPLQRPVHRVPHTQRDNVFGNDQLQSQTHKYVPPHHGHNSDVSLCIQTYNATAQLGQSRYQRFPHSPYQSVPPPVPRLSPGSLGYMTRLPAPHAYATVLAQGQIRKTATMKRTIVSKIESSSAKVGHQGWEKWRWDVADEVYAAMNTAEKKQIRNRCGARTFRAKKKGMSFPLL